MGGRRAGTGCVSDFARSCRCVDCSRSSLPEVANVLRKKCRRGEANIRQSEEALKAIQITISRFVPSIELVDDAFALSQTLDHSVYDCFYLACALPGAKLVTADEKFVTKCRSHGLGAFTLHLNTAHNAFSDDHARAFGVPLNKIEAIARLSEKMQQTFDFLYKSARRSEGGLFQTTSSDAYLPAFDSPEYRRLVDEMDKLTDDELGNLVALGWLGRTYHSVEEWPSFLENASGMVASGRTAHMTYFIPQMPNVARGLIKLRAVDTQRQ